MHGGAAASVVTSVEEGVYDHQHHNRSFAKMLELSTSRATVQVRRGNKSDDDGDMKRSGGMTRKPRSFIEFFDSPMPPHSAPSAPSLISLESSLTEITDAAAKAGRVEVDQGNQQSQAVSPPSKMLLSPTLSLPLLVMIDMFSVSLVVPLLFQYYKAAGVTSASQRELLSSVFSSSQIVGGLLLGALADAGWVRRRTILFVSFGGSALSYALIVYGGLKALVFSRVLVGVVKQTMTISTTLLTQCTTKEDRARHMGR